MLYLHPQEKKGLTMILIVDDDSAVRSSLTFLLKRAGYETQAVETPEKALETVRKVAPRLILMDMNFTRTTSGEEGLQLLKQVRIFRPDVPVILITAWGSISLAVQGMRNGAFDFMTKPWNNRQLLNSIQTAIELTAQKEEQPEPLNRTDADRKFRFDKIIGKSEALLDLLTTVSRIAPTNAAVLITGESGTGKELIAEAIHENSRRAGEAFVKVNLGGLSRSLFESEMFGHKKGAFTDARTDRKGRFEMADKGTVFLDEIGDLDLSCQVKLLRVLQDQTFEVLGDSRPRKVDVRIVSATNRDLRRMVADRTFREDLFYRINLITVHLPPLRERRDDIPLLASFFADRQAKKVQFTPEAIAYLKNQPYPGNIRELKNLVERTMLVSGKKMPDASDFRKQNRQDLSAKPEAALSGLTLDEIEKQTILRAIEKHSGNISHIASALGISRAALYRRLEKYSINPLSSDKRT
jgi:two-component system NtrC family response regulator